VDERELAPPALHRLRSPTRRHRNGFLFYTSGGKPNTGAPACGQLSSSGWDDQIVSELTFTFYPGRWSLPKPPAGFDDLLDRLERRGK